MSRVGYHPKQKVLVLALAGALAGMVSASASADCTVSAGPISWTSGDCTINPSVTVSGGRTGVDASTSLGTLTNSGTISGSNVDISNTGSITTLINNNGGVITGGNTGIRNVSGTISTLTNSGVISATLSGAFAGIDNTNGGTITTLTNNSGGVISSGNNGFFNDTNSTVFTLNNNSGGTIIGGSTGVFNAGTIGTLTNTGAISGSGIGIVNTSGSTITRLTNNSGGVITGHTGINNSGSIGTLSNSGTISGAMNAISNSTTGALGTIVNSGVIAGNIVNQANLDLNLNGGTGSSFGTLTGFSGGLGSADIGTISNISSNVNFGSGNLLLNDVINVGSNTVNNTGAALQVNNTINVTGNYNQAAGASLLFGVANNATATGSSTTDSGYGRLVVSGSATIASGSSVGLQKLNTYNFAAGQRFVVVQAASAGTNYNQSTLNYAASGFAGLVTGAAVADGSNSDLVLTLSGGANTVGTNTGGTNTGGTTGTGGGTTTTPPPALPVIPATTPNAVAALGGLANYTGVNPALLNLFDAAVALNQGSSATANRAGAQLSPTSQSAANQAAAAPTLDVLNVVAAHADSLRLAQADAASGVSTGESPPSLGVWGQAFGGHASQNERDSIDGYSANYGGLLFGVDKRITDQWSAGGVFSYTNAAINNTGNTAGDSSRVNAYGLIGYGSYTGKPWYANFSAGVVRQRYDTTRAVDFTGFSGVSNGQFNGMQYVAKTEVGYPLALSSVTMTPLVSLTYSRLNQDSYTESGGNGAALTIGSTNTTSVQSDVGVKFEREFATSYGNLVPSVRVAWRHEYDNTKLSTNASFAADPTGETGFTTVGANPVEDAAIVTLGATLLRANNLSLTARYEVQAASGFISQTGSVRLRQLF